MLDASTEIYGVNAEPSLPLEFGRRDPEFSALLDSHDDMRVQLLGSFSVQLVAAIANTDHRHRRFTRRLKSGMADNHRIKMPCLAHVVINHLANPPVPI